MSTTITFNVLSAKEVRKASNKLIKYKKKLNEKIDLFLKTLAEKGVEIAKENVAVYTGELQDSIDFEKREGNEKGDYYVIYTNCEYAVYVEFGTGVIGENNPHPMQSELGIAYAQGKTIYTRPDGKRGWWYIDRFGVKRFTEGMESRPFMFNTAEELRTIIEDVAREVFGGASDDLSS